MNYTEYVAAMRALLVETEDDAGFMNMLPNMIDYAELRIQRELNFLNTRAANTSVATVNGSRNVTAPSTFVVIDSLNLVAPAGTGNPESGTRIPLERVSLDFLDYMWPTAATTGTPAKYALLSDTAVKLAPTPDGAYTCEFIGTTRLTPLSADNATNFISNTMPDLLIAASMVFGAGAQGNYGSQADDPKMAQSWEAQYQTLKAGVNTEELRRKLGEQM